MNIEQEKISHSDVPREARTALSRMATAYIWHMENDPIYFLDREELQKYKEKKNHIYRVLERLKNGGAHLRGNVPTEELAIKWMAEMGPEKAYQMFKRIVEQMNFGPIDEQLEFTKNNSNRIPLKCGLIINSMLTRFRKNLGVSSYFLEHLKRIEDSKITTGTIREHINLSTVGIWEFNDTFLPYPEVYESQKSRDWIGPYLPRITRSIFKGAKEFKSELKDIGDRMAFGTEDEFRKLLHMGMKPEFGLTPMLFYKIASGQAEHKLSQKYIGLEKEDRLIKYLKETNQLHELFD